MGPMGLTTNTDWFILLFNFLHTPSLLQSRVVHTSEIGVLKVDLPQVR
jgi:hypothetical protein